MARGKITGRQALILLVLLLVISPITALVSAKIASSLWNQLLSPQYGSGPTYRSWYGISLLSSYALHGVSRDGPGEDESIWVWTLARIATWVFFGLFLYAAAKLVCL